MGPSAGARFSGKRRATTDGPSLIQTESMDVEQPRRSQKIKRSRPTDPGRRRSAPADTDTLRILCMQDEVTVHHNQEGVSASMCARSTQLAEMNRELSKLTRENAQKRTENEHLRVQVAALDRKLSDSERRESALQKRAKKKRRTEAEQAARIDELEEKTRRAREAGARCAD